MKETYLSAERLHQVLGTAAAHVVANFGGRRIYIPKAARLTRDHRLVRVLGAGIARDLAAMCPPGYAVVTGSDAYARYMRGEAIMRDAFSASASLVARLHGVSRRTVFFYRGRIRARRRDAGRARASSRR